MSYQYIDETGTIVPDTADLKAEVQQEYLTGIATDLNLADETPQGVMISAEALARAEVVANNAAVANQINPNIAGGVFLAAICALTGLDVPQGEPSLCQSVAVGGQPFTVIPAGSPAYFGTVIFLSVTAVILSAAGTGVVDFQSADIGPVPCPAHSLNTPGAVLGWETVNNPADAILGTLAPTDAEVRALRANTLALQGIGLNEAITSALNDTPGVRSIQYRENYTAAPATIDGINLVANSIWACVSGGLDADVALALVTTKSLGSNWNGAVTVNVVDPTTGQTYPVKFDRPTNVRTWVKVTYKTGTLTGDPVTQIRAALQSYANGEISGMSGFTVGTGISPFELAAAVVAELPGTFVMKVEVSTDGVTYVTTEILLTLKQIATLSDNDVTVIAA